ncbi:MAG: phenylalanine--tRNA ligase subunit beta [Sulfurimonas sp.]|uniref:phenylalanine--tRNA ligase subunit beta n=1 Tax=Sulfurimonas sp. TaxID=2022749 RepID=UPI00261BF04B|nr:phenylalanine--tRNA ligase subunit beta [Sulfurimonas sp.]MDD2652521.1 phenylalanine--tRNA ligase subunit beta [Sulfurimonas sp.]MDD3451304.1 phenylalanine--tRNA ligase subunit beta [Sulfurimonas sp.]
MIITRSWLNEWIDLSTISTDKLAKTLNSIGLEVDSVTTYKIPQKIVFGRVLECEKHPDADKLNVCKVDTGDGVKQIVCGASNVRAGLDVVVATIGAVMPDGTLIKPVVLRGVASEGMICSSREIGFGDVQDGILELDSSIGQYNIGEELSTNPIFSDSVIEIELTANRGDCLSIRGIARDLSAAFDKPLREIAPREDEEKRVGIGRVLSLWHENNLDVEIRYKAVDFKNFVLPLIMKIRLAQIEEKQESFVESLMVYATHGSGVVLRAYEHAFFCAAGETMAKISLSKDANGFASIKAKDRVASIVGVSQEAASKAAFNEGLMLIEATYIPPEIISKKMQENKIPSEAAYYRASRGSEPELNQGLDYCIGIIDSYSDSSVYGGTIEIEEANDDKIISVSKKEIDEIIGANIDKAKITKIFKNLGFDTTKSSADNFIVVVPRYRHDIVNKQDIVEEIVRLVGIDNIPSKPFTFTEANSFNDDYRNYKKRENYRHKAAYNGFFESVHFVFDEKKVLQEYGFETVDETKELLNPIVNTLDTLRTTLLTGLLKATSNNSKNGYASVKLFEVGSVFDAQRNESLKMALLLCGDREAESLSNAGKPSKVDFAFFAQKLSSIIGSFELRQFTTKHALSHPYQSAEIFIEGESVGEMFRLHPNVEESFDLDVTYMCELDFEKLPYALKTAKTTSRYQASFRDLSVVMPKNMPYAKVKDVISACAVKELVRFYPVDKYSDAALGDNMSFSIRFVLQSNDKTLEEDDITKAMGTILNALGSELGIGIR